jgi:hypothetical protein
MNASPKSHFLDARVVHYEWNNAIAPRLTIDPGDSTGDRRDHPPVPPPGRSSGSTARRSR